MNGLKYAAAEFPVIKSIWNEILNEETSWYSTANSERLESCRENVEQYESELLELAGEDKALTEQMKGILANLSNTNCAVESELCDMAFIAGFKAASKLFGEAFK